MMRARVGLALVACGSMALFACGSDAPGCPDGSEVVEVDSEAGLAEAIASASAGTCIHLAAGTYGTSTVAGWALPGGVSLVGASSSSVRVRGVALGAGPGALLSNLTVEAGGVSLMGAQQARVEGVRIQGASGAALTLGAQTTVAVSKTEIASAAGDAIAVHDATSVALSDVTVAGAAGPGLWAQCTGGCDCAAPVQLSVSHVTIHDAHGYGIALLGVSATLDEVTVADVHPTGTELPGGFAASACADVTAKRLHVLDGDPIDASYGILVDDANAALGGPAEADGIDVAGAFIGMWVQNTAKVGSTPKAVTLEHAVVDQSRGVGFGLGLEAKGIIIHWFQAKDTSLVTMATDAGSSDVGDGFLWQKGSEAQIDEMVLSGSARNAMLIDGPVGGASSLAHVTLQGGDEAKGIVQQGVQGASQAPDIDATSPAVAQQSDRPFAVPMGPQAPQP